MAHVMKADPDDGSKILQTGEIIASNGGQAKKNNNYSGRQSFMSKKHLDSNTLIKIVYAVVSALIKGITEINSKKYDVRTAEENRKAAEARAREAEARERETETKIRYEIEQKRYEEEKKYQAELERLTETINRKMVVGIE